MNMPPRRLFLSLGAALVAALSAVLLAAQWNAQTHLDTRKIAVAAVESSPAPGCAQTCCSWWTGRPAARRMARQASSPRLKEE